MKRVAKSKTSVRKSPKQGRSRTLVSSVIEAATRILESIGADSTTTNRIAEKAGVSIGSLYQYFPNKDSIFAQMIESQTDLNAIRFQRIIDENRKADPDFVIEVLVDEVVTFFDERRVFVRELFAIVPKLKKTREVLYRRNRMLGIFIAYLKTLGPRLRNPDEIERSVYVIAHSLAGVLHTAALEDFESCSPQELRGELKALVSAYLFKA